MGYLNTREITVEAVLTKKGREKVANGEPLGITRYALADDEVDYSLWRADHPNGSEFAGNVILNQPLFEAFVDETQVMRYKLVSLPRRTAQVPVITVANENIILRTPGQTSEISPITRNGTNDQLGYTAVLHNAEIANLSVAPGASIDTTTGTVPAFLSDRDETRTQTRVGRRFTITSLPVRNDSTTRVTLVGNETGGSITIDIEIRAEG